MKQLFLSLFALFLYIQASAQPSCFSMYVSTEAATPGEVVCLDVTAEGIDNLLGFQYTLHWDPSALRFNRLENFSLPSLGASSFSTQPAAVDNGRISVSWFDGSLSGVDVSGGQVVYSICFETLDAPAALHAVYFSGTPTRIEFANANTELITNYSLVNGGAYTGSGTVPAISYACALPPDCQGGDGAIDISVAGGQPGNTFDWRKGNVPIATTEDLSGDIGGRYSLLVTNPQGVVASAVFSLVPEGLPYIGSWQIDDATCGAAGNGSISVSIPGGPGNADLLWSNGSTGNTANGLAAGSYGLEVSNAAGCSYEEYFTVGQETDIDAYFTYECTGSAGNYTADVACTVASGGAAPFTFNWNTGQVETQPQSSTISGVPGVGDYLVTITDANGCVQAVAPLGLDCAQGSQFLTAYAYECQFFGGDSSLADVTLAVWSGGTPPYTFEWSNGEVDVDSVFSVNEGLVNGTYSATITDANGLVYVPEPAMVDCEPAPQNFIVGSNYECTFFPSEDSVSIDISALVWAGPPPPYTFSWSTGEVQTDTLLSTITVSATGAYSVTISDAAGNTYVESVNATNCGPASPLLSIGEASALPGEIVCVEVTAAQVQGLDSLLLALQWNPGFMTLDHVQPGLIASGFNLADTAGGIFQLDWASGGQPVNTSGEAVLFELCFQLLAPAGQSIALDFYTSLQVPEAYDSNGEAIGLDWQGGAILVASDSPADAVQINVESASVAPGASTCLDITTSNFTDILGLQFSVRWDTAVLRFDSLVLGDLPGLSQPAHFNLNDTGNGLLRFSWFEGSLVPVSLPNGAAFFTLCFTTAAVPGSSGVTISSVPTAIEASNANMVLPVAINNGVVITLDPEVWPGDTDADETVNHFDLLNIGLAYGASGPPRPAASIDWVQQAGSNWQQATPLSLINYKHIDADGNGLIDAADTLAIAQNWGLETGEENRPEPDMEFARQLPTVLYVKPDTVTLGAPAVFDVILGDETAPAEDIYGLAFTIVYDTAAVEPGSASMAFGNSWIGQQPQSLLALSRDSYNDGRIDVALTRTDGQNVSGQGPIAQLHITIQDVIFRGGEYEMLLDIENVRLINNVEEWAEVVSEPSTIGIGGTVSSTDTQAREAGVKAWPVPAKDRIFIHSPLYPVQQVEVLGMDGRSLLIAQQASELSVAHLPAGTYFLRIWTAAGVSVRRMVVVD